MSEFEDAVESVGSHSDGLRQRVPWEGDKASISSSIPSLQEDKELLEDELAEDDRDIGCPLPSTPIDASILHDEVTQSLNVEDGLDAMNHMAHDAVEHAEEFVRKVWQASWNVCHFQHLPQWLQDNDFLHTGHRPPLYTFKECFKSIFRVHTETGNIWTHLLGCIAFIGISIYFTYSVDIELKEKLVFAAFFLGAIVCLGLSFAFHTLHCHSEHVGRLFSKLDYCGIALLIMGSFVPWLYYGFYCSFLSKVIYLTSVVILGAASIIVSLTKQFSAPNYRPLRAGVFMSFGLSGVVPAMHYGYVEGWFSKVAQASLGWLLLMGVLYIIGGLIYALRVPERYFPGKCDIWFQSHQIFHVLVVSAAFVHYHGITEMAMYRLSSGGCEAPQPVAL
ncbi:adiponectin receptor protein [Diaphorina citri]|uniref:Adiponectin receptor protein n=1 Tax=Diaphorina citri TaxID=121845 RepID=A0A1S3DSE2_DIACI|nr:adiponectin receptor protein [Diaphorina citri]